MRVVLDRHKVVKIDPKGRTQKDGLMKLGDFIVKVEVEGETVGTKYGDIMDLLKLSDRTRVVTIFLPGINNGDDDDDAPPTLTTTVAAAAVSTIKKGNLGGNNRKRKPPPQQQQKKRPPPNTKRGPRKITVALATTMSFSQEDYHYHFVPKNPLEIATAGGITPIVPPQLEDFFLSRPQPGDTVYHPRLEMLAKARGFSIKDLEKNNGRERWRGRRS